jgi:hypothetical protein
MCGGFHPTSSGCNVEVNLKRVADEAGPVLKGIGECKRGDSCPFSHPETYKGTKKVPVGAGAQPAKTTGPEATAPDVPTAVPTAQIDGPVAGTLCKQCKKKERYREGGKTHPYCGKKCEEEAVGRKIGQSKPDAKLSNNVMIEEEDSAWRGSDYMAMAGISHVEMMKQANRLGFVSVTGTEHVGDEGSMYSPGMVELLQSIGFHFMNEFSEVFRFTGAGYYSVLDNAETHDGYRITGYHDKIPDTLSPVLEMVQEVHDVFGNSDAF